MIKVKKGEVTLKGTPVDLCGELSVVISGIINAMEENNIPREEAVGLVKKSCELGFKTREELHEEAKQSISNLLMKLANDLKTEGEKADE